MANNCPCNGCVPPKRRADCHENCPEYIKWNNEHQQKLDKIRDMRREHNDCFPGSLYRGSNKKGRMI